MHIIDSKDCDSCTRSSPAWEHPGIIRHASRARVHLVGCCCMRWWNRRSKCLRVAGGINFVGGNLRGAMLIPHTHWSLASRQQLEDTEYIHYIYTHVFCFTPSRYETSHPPFFAGRLSNAFLDFFGLWCHGGWMSRYVSCDLKRQLRNSMKAQVQPLQTSISRPSCDTLITYQCLVTRMNGRNKISLFQKQSLLRNPTLKITSFGGNF